MELQIGFGDHEIVPSGLKRDEVEVKKSRSGSNPDTGVCLTSSNGPRNLEMR